MTPPAASRSCGARFSVATSVWSCVLPVGHAGLHRNRASGMADVEWEGDPCFGAPDDEIIQLTDADRAAKRGKMHGTLLTGEEAERVRRMLDEPAAAAMTDGLGRDWLDQGLDTLLLAIGAKGENGHMLPGPARLLLENEIRSRLSTIERDAARMRERERELRFAGGQLANVAFNLAQNGVLDERTRETLDACRKLWDSTTEKHSAALEMLASQAQS